MSRSSRFQSKAQPASVSRAPGFECRLFDFLTSMAPAVKGVKPKEREADALFAVQGHGMRGLPESRSQVKTIR
jgi:hypothetical protein